LANAVDVLVHDLPASLHHAALHVDQGLTPGTTLLTSEHLAWAVRPDDKKMRTAADRYLRTIRASGELQTLFGRFLPFYSSSAYSPRP
jgi:ABC-type amino acid transport substrate-binding protein